MVSKANIKTGHKKARKNLKTNFFKKPFNSLSSSLLAIFIALIILNIGIYVFTYTNQTFAANFADNVLRPIIGDKATIAIEAAFFKVEDSLNQIKYSFVKPNTASFVKSPYANKKIIIKNVQTFTLNNISPFSNFPPLSGEGVWVPIYTGTSEAVMAKTFVRPDPKRSYAVTYLVKMNMNDLSLSAVAGIYQPGGRAEPGPGKIPSSVQKTNNLIVAFNGGFQKKDGHYGMIVGNTTYLPLEKNLATLVIYKNAKPKIVDYTGQDLGQNVVAIRQNGPMLLENSQDVTSSSAWNMQTWGLTTTDTMYTWRSGIGITKNGNLIYAAGPSLIPQTLAAALKAAGAVNAMQMDINPVWVRFVIFNSYGNGLYHYYSLTKDMTNGGYQYLTGYQKDFFYLVEK